MGLVKPQGCCFMYKRQIPDAQKVGNTWMLPEDAGKPSDARIKSGKYLKRNIENEMSEGEKNGETI